MKKLLSLSAFLILGTTAYSQLYFGAGAAYYFSEATNTSPALAGGGGQDRYDGLGGIANIGYKDPTNGWHMELEFQYFEPASTFGTGSANVTNVEGENYTYMVNAYFDILESMETNWQLIVGGGLGFTNLHQTVKIEGPSGHRSDSDDKWLFTWQLLGGLAWQPVDMLRFDLTYRYTDPKDGNFTVFGERMKVQDYTFQSVELSATITF